MAIDRFDTLDLDAGENEKFYRDDFGERIVRHDKDDMPAEEADMEAADKNWSDPADKPVEEADKQLEDDFRESLNDNEQIGDEKLMDEAEKDYDAGLDKDDDQDVDRV